MILEDVVNRRIRDELIGEDPMRREWLWHRMWELDRIEEFPVYVLGLVDIALHDLVGKALGVPVYELLGAFRSEIPAYASTVTFSSIEEYLDVADQCLELGYRAIKLHAWGDARRDAELAQALRAHVGDGVDLMYDGSAGFDLPDAVYLGRALAETGYRWYEEPIREFSVTSYRWLAERVEVPLLVARDLRRRAHEHRRLHRLWLRKLRAHERKLEGRLHRSNAHRPHRRLLPPTRRGHRWWPARRPPLHGHPEHDLLRVPRYGEPRCAEQSRRSGRARAHADGAGDRLPGS